MKNLLILPRWSIVLFIISTVALTFVALAEIWFPDLINGDIFDKILGTYALLIASSFVVHYMGRLLRKLPDDKKMEE